MIRLRLLAGPLATLAALAAILYLLGPVSPWLCVLAIAAEMAFAVIAVPGLRLRWKGWRERRRHHLSRAEWDSRKHLGMDLDHLERLVYEVPHGDEMHLLKAELWPHGWAHIIEQHWRDSERRWLP